MTKYSSSKRKHQANILSAGSASRWRWNYVAMQRNNEKAARNVADVAAWRHQRRNL